MIKNRIVFYLKYEKNNNKIKYKKCFFVCFVMKTDIQVSEELLGKVYKKERGLLRIFLSVCK
jgi:hypothetical protein